MTYPKRAPVDARARSMSKRPISCARAPRRAGGSPTCSSSAASSSGIPSGADRAEGSGRVRARRRAPSAAASSSSACFSSALTAAQRFELLGVGLPLSFVRGQLVDPRDERAPALVGREERVERLGRALARERLPPASGSLRAALRSITPGSLGRRRVYLPATEETYAATSADLLIRERAGEGRHRALTVRHAVVREVEARHRVVEVRARPSRRSCVRERVAAPQPDAPRKTSLPATGSPCRHPAAGLRRLGLGGLRRLGLAGGLRLRRSPSPSTRTRSSPSRSS